MNLSPKEQASTLIKEFYNVKNLVYSVMRKPIRKEVARQNAIKAVINIIKVLSMDPVDSNEDIFSHWTQTLQCLKDLNFEYQKDCKDIALTMMNLLINVGASFEDEDTALAIMIETIKKS